MGPRRLGLLEFLAGAVKAALTGIDDALEAIEGRSASSEGVAKVSRCDFGVFLQEEIVGGAPEVGFDAAQTADTPLAADHGVDEETLIGVSRAVKFVKFGGKFSEILGGFGEHDLLFGVNAVLQGVEARFGFSGSGDRAGGFLSVGPAGGALSACGHIGFLNDESIRRIFGWIDGVRAKWL